VCLSRGLVVGKRSVDCLHQYCVSIKGIGSGEALCVLSSSVLCAYEKGGVITESFPTTNPLDRHTILMKTIHRELPHYQSP
jgi:hypothetical protein